MLGWTLGTPGAAGSLAAIVHHDLDLPGQAPAVLSLPETAATATGGW
ncbi:hypothetical protein [Streptomyces sp. NPDC049555]